MQPAFQFGNAVLVSNFNRRELSEVRADFDLPLPELIFEALREFFVLLLAGCYCLRKLLVLLKQSLMLLPEQVLSVCGLQTLAVHLQCHLRKLLVLTAQRRKL